MAQEILVIDRDTVIFFGLYTPAPIVIAGVAWPLRETSDKLPVIASDFLQSNTPGVFAAIDNGLVAWELRPIERSPRESVAHLRERYEEKWRRWKASEDARIARWADEIVNVRWVNVR